MEWRNKKHCHVFLREKILRILKILHLKRVLQKFNGWGNYATNWTFGDSSLISFYLLEWRNKKNCHVFLREKLLRFLKILHLRRVLKKFNGWKNYATNWTLGDPSLISFYLWCFMLLTNYVSSVFLLLARRIKCKVY